MSKALKIITPEELQRLLDYFKRPTRRKYQRFLNSRNLLMFTFLAETGLRVGELTKLVLLDLLIDKEPVNWLIVRAEIAKGRVSREIPLSQRARETINFLRSGIWFPMCLEPTDYAFHGSTPKEPISTRQVQRIIEQASIAALGYKIHPHVLRHTFATRILRSSNIRIVQKLLGHKNINTTQLYTHPNNQDLKEAVESAGS